MNYDPRGEAIAPRYVGTRVAEPVRYEFATSDTLRDLIQAIRARLWIVVVTIFISIACGAAYALLRDRLYEAASEIYIDPRGLEVVDRDVTRQTETTDGNAAWVESQMRVMTSGELLNRIVASEGLAEDPEFGAKRLGILGQLHALLGSDPEARENPLAKLSEAVTTYRPQRSYIVEVHVRTTSAEKSARLSDAIARSYLSFSEQSQSSLARRASGSLTKKAEELRRALSEAERRVEEFRQKNGLVGAKGVLVSETTLTETNALLTDAARKLSEARARRDQIRAAMSSGDVGSIPEAVKSPAITQLRAAYQSALEARQTLAETLGSRHPRMRMADVKVAESKAAVAAEFARIADSAEAEYKRAADVQNDLAKRLGGLESNSFAVDESLVQLRELQRDVEANRNVYTAYLQRATELAGQEEIDMSASRIISFAQVPRDPVGPGTALILSAAAILGLLAGLLMALVGAAISSSYRSAR